MLSRRYHISIVLMLLAILAVVAFQGYWLSKNFNEEKQLLHLKTNVVFREAVNNCQLIQLKLDTNVKVGMTRRLDMGTAVRNIQIASAVPDSIKSKAPMKGAVMITVNEKTVAGSGDLEKNLRSEEHTSELQSHHDLVCRLLLEK